MVFPELRAHQTAALSAFEQNRDASRFHFVLPPGAGKTLLGSVIAQQVAWAKDFRERYPKLGEAMRALTTTEDTPSATSFETYLRGELGTYSDQTFERYEAMIGERAAASPQRNITEETLLHTVQLGGFDTLEEAEASQA